MDVSNPDKEYFPGVSKREVVEHYALVADVMLPFVVDRPLTLERYPNGVLQKGFMQKNASKHFPDFIGRVEIQSTNATTIHPTIRDADGLLYLANQGTITFHVPSCRTDDLGMADRFVVDLDPAGDDPGPVADVAHATRAMLARFGLDATAMITGSKGIHVSVALEPRLPTGRAGLVTRALSGLIAAQLPKLATIEFLKKERGGRVFVDWLRNRPGQTVASPWSLRPRPEASVAVPVSWDEVGSIVPSAVTIHDVADRLERDIAWAPPMDLGSAVDDIVAAATDAGVDLETPFDRFGRR